MWNVNSLGTASNGKDSEIRIELNHEHYHDDKPKFDIFKVTAADGIIHRELLKDRLNLEDAVAFVNQLADKLNEEECQRLKLFHSEAKRAEREHAERVKDYENRKARNSLGEYWEPCKTCGKYFVGVDWVWFYKPYCSKACELADCGKISPYRRREINLFWRDIGKDFHLLEDITP